MPSQLPFRLPCEAVAGAPKYYLGGPFQHGALPVNVDKYVNVTTVPNTTGPGTVPPYERWQDNPDNDCSRNNCRQADGGAPCQPWQPPFTPNTFQKNGQVNLAVTHKKGFKSVQARKYWQGVFGFREMETCEGPDTATGCGVVTPPAPGIVRYRTAQTTPVRSRYLSASVSSSYKFTEYSYSGGSQTPIVIANDNLQFTQSIDKNSGLLSINITSPVGSSSAAINPIYFWNWSQAANRMTTLVSTLPAITSSANGT